MITKIRLFSAGCVYSEEELKSIAKVCRKFEIIVLSDEIYAQCSFHGHRNGSKNFTVTYWGRFSAISRSKDRILEIGKPKNRDRVVKLYLKFELVSEI